MAQQLVPITRLGKFFGGEDFALDISMGREWLGGDMNFTIVLYKVDRTKTVQDDVYGEVQQDGIQFLHPTYRCLTALETIPLLKVKKIYLYITIKQIRCSNSYYKKLILLLLHLKKNSLCL